MLPDRSINDYGDYGAEGRYADYGTEYFDETATDVSVPSTRRVEYRAQPREERKATEPREERRATEPREERRATEPAKREDH